MNLSEARVDLEGQLVAAGKISYAVDPAGHFTPRRHDHLRVSLRETGIRIVGARVWPDAGSGFLVVEEIPPVVFLPSSLSLIIRNALERQPSGPVHAALANEEGRLASESSPETSRNQPLSDWTLDIDAGGEDLKVVITAALRGLVPFPQWQKSAGNFWTATGEDQPRATIEFDVNFATRIAMFGTIFLGFRDHALLEPAPGPATAAENPKLGDAPVTLSGGIFGYDSGGGWINIFDSRSFPRCVVLTRCRPQQRYANGFLSSDTAPIGPTVSFIGLDMTQIIDAALGNGRCGFIELRDGWFGSLMWHREEHADIEHARIELRLADCGLEFSYYAASTKPRENPDHPRSVSGKFTIPWEILILRYPRLGCHNPRAKMHRSRASQ